MNPRCESHRDFEMRSMLSELSRFPNTVMSLHNQDVTMLHTKLCEKLVYLVRWFFSAI